MAPSNSSTSHLFTSAFWIWPESPTWDLHNCYALFRKIFELKKIPRRAPLAITADQSYQLYINGKFVARGPARGFQEKWPYDEIDIRRYLCPGKNIIAVRAHHPGFSNFLYLSKGFAGLLVCADWPGITLATDRSWKCRRQSGVRKDVVTTSLQLFSQEHFDAREEVDDWMELAFDDSSWGSTEMERRPTSMPWCSLEPRGIPMLAEKTHDTIPIAGTASGKCAQDFRESRDVARLCAREQITHALVTHEEFGSPRPIPTTGSGAYRSYLIDWGRTMVGTWSVEVHRARGGEIIDLVHGETISSEGVLDQKFPTHCRIAFGNRLICRPGVTRHTFYHPFGFRYAVLIVRDTTTDLALNLRFHWVGYPLERQAAFHSSDPGLNQIWEACAWTQQCCSLDAYVDTPWREQAQWWGDARVQAQNTFHLNADARLFRRGIAQIASQSTPDGVTYGHAPTMAHTCILPDFTLIWMLTLWDYYWQTGSLEPFLAHQITLQRALSYFEDRLHSKYDLLAYDDRYWLFLDWTPIFKRGYSSLYSLWFLIALERVSLLYKLADASTQARATAALALRVRRGLKKLIGHDGLIRDGLTFAPDPSNNREGGFTAPDLYPAKNEGDLVDSTSVHSQTLALLAGLKPASESNMLSKILVPFIREEIKPKVHPSAYWMTYVFELLIDRGYEQDVVRYIRKYWANMAAYGTTWENFTPNAGEESHSHAWSAHPLYHLLRTLGGVRQTAANWKEVRVRPLFEGDFCQSAVATPHGIIRSNWERRDNNIQFKLELPKGIRAMVELPGITRKRVTGQKTWKITDGKE